AITSRSFYALARRRTAGRPAAAARRLMRGSVRNPLEPTYHPRSDPAGTARRPGPGHRRRRGPLRGRGGQRGLRRQAPAGPPPHGLRHPRRAHGPRNPRPGDRPGPDPGRGRGRLMDKIVVTGGVALEGEVRISGAKNAVLPILCATLLADGPVEIGNVPDLHDVRTTARLLRGLGAQVEHAADAAVVRADPPPASGHGAPYGLLRPQRSSVLLLGPLLVRQGAVEVSLPGGCAIGSRAVVLHMRALEAVGAEITVEHGYIKARAGRLRGGEVKFDMVSVGATENVLMAATLAEGTTTIDN